MANMGPDREPARPRTTVHEPSMIPKSKEARVGKLGKLSMAPISTNLAGSHGMSWNYH